MSQQDLQLSFDFPAEDTRKTVPAEHIAAPEDGSLLEEIPEPEENFSLFSAEDFELPPPQSPVEESEPQLEPESIPEESIAEEEPEQEPQPLSRNDFYMLDNYPRDYINSQLWSGASDISRFAIRNLFRALVR